MIIKDKKREYKPETEEIAVDLVPNPLFATDKGDLKRMANIQRRGINHHRTTSTFLLSIGSEALVQGFQGE